MWGKGAEKLKSVAMVNVYKRGSEYKMIGRTESHEMFKVLSVWRYILWD